MKNVMLDLETYGNTPGCGVVSIGAVAFDFEKGALGKEFYCVFDRRDMKSLEMHDDPDTMAWWGRQSAEAKRVLEDAMSDDRSVRVGFGLRQFATYLREQGKIKDVALWGNGSDFDNMILGMLYDKAKITRPWLYSKNRCFRTLRALSPVEPKWQRIGTYHNALDDAKTQAIHAIQIFNIMKGKRR